MTFKEIYSNKQYIEESRSKRYKDFFEDYVRYYEQVTGKSAVADHVIGSIEINIKKALHILQREDRIMWYLRLIKFNYYLDTVTREHFKKSDGEWDDNTLITLPKYAAHYFYLVFNKDAEQYPFGVIKAVRYTVFNVLSTILHTIEHYLSLPIPEINSYIFNNQKPKDILEYFKNLEDEWIEEGGDTAINITQDLKRGTIEKLITFDGGKSAWFDLKRPSCKEEGRAMGHCGNSPRSNSTDTILSYRTINSHKGIITSASHLTFILNDKGELTESKGKGNNKPAAKYHPYIIDLLLYKKPDGSYLIKKIVGGGFKPENNFTLNDLSTKDRESLYSKRPDLRNP